MIVTTHHNWINKNGFVDQEPFYNYLISVYWATQTITTVGFGDIYIGEVSEYIFATLFMAFGASFYSYLVGSISQIVGKSDARAFKI